MTHFFQIIFIAFAFIGIGHTLILILYNVNNKLTRIIDIKYELAIIIVIIFTFAAYAFTGEI